MCHGNSGCSSGRPLVARDEARKCNLLFANRWRRSSSLLSSLLNDLASIALERNSYLDAMADLLRRKRAAIRGQRRKHCYINLHIGFTEAKFLS